MTAWGRGGNHPVLDRKHMMENNMDTCEFASIADVYERVVRVAEKLGLEHPSISQFLAGIVLANPEVFPKGLLVDFEGRVALSVPPVPYMLGLDRDLAQAWLFANFLSEGCASPDERVH